MVVGRLLLLCSLLVACDRGTTRPAENDTAVRGGEAGPGPGEDPTPPDPTRPADPAGPADSPAVSGPRVVMVAADHPQHDRLEGAGFANDCKTDGDCHVGGCSGEVCSAEEGVNTTCDVLPLEWPEGRACGCVDGSCVWWHPSQTLPAAGSPPAPASGVDEDPGRDAPAGPSCGGRRCKPPEECVTYYGIAGPNGPAMHSCEVRCRPGQDRDCPKGHRCVLIADGPGHVCRKGR